MTHVRLVDMNRRWVDNNSLKIISHTAVPVIKLTTQGYVPGFNPMSIIPTSAGTGGSGGGGGGGGVGGGGGGSTVTNRSRSPNMTNEGPRGNPVIHIDKSYHPHDHHHRPMSSSLPATPTVPSLAAPRLTPPPSPLQPPLGTFTASASASAPVRRSSNRVPPTQHHSATFSTSSRANAESDARACDNGNGNSSGNDISNVKSNGDDSDDVRGRPPVPQRRDSKEDEVNGEEPEPRVLRSSVEMASHPSPGVSKDDKIETVVAQPLPLRSGPTAATGSGDTTAKSAIGVGVADGGIASLPPKPPPPPPPSPPLPREERDGDQPGHAEHDRQTREGDAEDSGHDDTRKSDRRSASHGGVSHDEREHVRGERRHSSEVEARSAVDQDHIFVHDREPRIESGSNRAYTGAASGGGGPSPGAGIDAGVFPRVLVDVSFEAQGHNGQAANQLVKDLVDGFPALRPLALLLKQVTSSSSPFSRRVLLRSLFLLGRLNRCRYRHIRVLSANSCIVSSSI